MATPLDGTKRKSLPAGQEVRLPKASELVANAIRRQIVTGVLQEGDLLPREATLMSQFNVSRPTLRESFRVLESEGFIRIRRGSNGGAQVRLPSDDDASRYFGALLQVHQTSLADSYEARTIIEAPAAGMAAARRTPADLEILRLHIVKAEASFDDPVALFDALNLFHRLVVEAAGNSTLRLMSGLLDRILDRASCAFVASAVIPDRSLTPLQQPSANASHRAHVRLFELIEAGDAVGAETLWRKHLTHTADEVLHSPGAKTVLDLMSSPYVTDESASRAV